MNALIKLIDVVIILGLLYVIVVGYGASHQYYQLVGLSAAVLYVLLSEVVNAHIHYYAAFLLREIIVTSCLWFVVLGCAIVFLFLAKESAAFSRVVVVSWGISVPIVLFLWHLTVRRFMSSRMRQVKGMSKAAIIGTGDLCEKVKRTLNNNPWLGYQYIGNYDDRQTAGRGPGPEYFLGDYKAMMEDAKAGRFDVIFIALPLEAQVRIMTLIDNFGDTTVTVYLVPDFFLTDLAKGNWHQMAGLPVLGIFDTPFWGVSSWVKRAEDFVIGGLILTLIAIPMIFIAMAIKLTSPGPVIFRQKRYGMDGREISVLKFRSMSVLDDGSDIRQAKRGDERVTAVGAVLRKTSLDELPQFINVVSGSMSIVGPRPHAVSHNEEYRKHIRGYMLRHKVKPGITGWAQINGWRGETDTVHKMKMRLEHDLWYLENWSLWLDIKTIFITIFVGFTGKNAY